jgi:hypothetical protein
MKEYRDGLSRQDRDGTHHTGHYTTLYCALVNLREDSPMRRYIRGLWACVETPIPICFLDHLYIRSYEFGGFIIYFSMASVLCTCLVNTPRQWVPPFANSSSANNDGTSHVCSPPSNKQPQAMTFSYNSMIPGFTFSIRNGYRKMGGGGHTAPQVIDILFTVRIKELCFYWVLCTSPTILLHCTQV